MENYEFLKPVLGEELFTQFAAKMGSANGITLVNANDGSYIPKAKFDNEVAAKKQYSGQVAELSKQAASLEKRIEELTEQLNSAKATNANAQELQTKVDELTAELETKKKALSDSKALSRQIEQLTATVADKDRAIETLSKTNRVSGELRSAGARNPDVLMKMIDLDQVGIADGKVTGLKEQIEALRVSDPYLFTGEPSPKGGVDDGGTDNSRAVAPRAKNENENINDELRRAAGREI